MFILRVWEFPVPVFGLVYSASYQSVEANAGHSLKVGQGSFLTVAFQFALHSQSPFSCRLGN
jgi:hypothetical protein